MRSDADNQRHSSCLYAYIAVAIPGRLKSPPWSNIRRRLQYNCYLLMFRCLCFIYSVNRHWRRTSARFIQLRTSSVCLQLISRDWGRFINSWFATDVHPSWQSPAYTKGNLAQTGRSLPFCCVVSRFRSHPRFNLLHVLHKREKESNATSLRSVNRSLPYPVESSSVCDGCDVSRGRWGSCPAWRRPSSVSPPLVDRLARRRRRPGRRLSLTRGRVTFVQRGDNLPPARSSRPGQLRIQSAGLQRPKLLWCTGKDTVNCRIGLDSARDNTMR